MVIQHRFRVKMSEAVEVQQLASPLLLVRCVQAGIPGSNHAIHVLKCKCTSAPPATRSRLFRHPRQDMTELLRERAPASLEAGTKWRCLKVGGQPAARESAFLLAVNTKSSIAAQGFQHECGNGQGKPRDGACNARFHAVFSILHMAWCDCGDGEEESGGAGWLRRRSSPEPG